MIISALARYYDCLAQMDDSPLAPAGKSKIKVGYIAVIDKEGNLVDVLPHFKKVLFGKKEVEQPISELFPQRIDTTKTMANIIEHRPKYIFGLQEAENELSFAGNQEESFEDCKKKNIAFLGGIDSEISKAMKKFYEKWDPKEQTQNPILLGILKKINGNKFSFCLDSDPTEYIHNDSAIWEKIENQNAEKKVETGKVSQCSICGEKLKIADLHDGIKGIAGANSTGSKLVCCNNPADYSYGKDQAYISGISEKVMKKYTQAFNALAEGGKNKSIIGDMTVLFWAETTQNANDYTDIFGLTNGLSYIGEDIELTVNVKECVKMLSEGKIPDVKELNLDENTKFYVLGATPNSSRLSIKLFYENSFGAIFENVKDHIENILVKKDQRIPSLYNILNELVSPNGKDKIPNSGLVAGISNSILTRGMYPQNMLEEVIRRIKTDQDTDKNQYVKMNDVRVGIIKAYFMRKNKIMKKGENLTMALNLENTEKSYLCGRLFAILEKLQNDAISGINAGIKARYFGSACVTPSMVFPRLIKLAQNHINKLEKAYYLESKMRDIIDKMGDNFPNTLSIEEQGKFIIGYYQQNKDLYSKKGE